MEEKKTDRRAQKTKKAIYGAFISLLTQKELHKVTVQDISDLADINRTTFYKHYLDVYDLYDKFEQDMLIEWGMLVLQMQELRSKDFFTKLVDYVEKNNGVFKMVFGSNAPSNLRDKFVKMLEGLFQKIESEKKGSAINNVKLSYQTSYRARGCIAILSRWLEEDSKQPKDFIVQVLSELDSSVVKVM